MIIFPSIGYRVKRIKFVIVVGVNKGCCPSIFLPNWNNLIKAHIDIVFINADTFNKGENPFDHLIIIRGFVIRDWIFVDDVRQINVVQ